jgi:hypothetical protein
MRTRRQFIAPLAMLAALFFSSAHAAPPPILMSVNSTKKQISQPGTKTKARGLSFDVRIQNPLTNAVKCKMEWYFVASLVDGFGYFVSSQGAEDLTIAPRGVLETTKAAPLLTKAKAEDPDAKPKKFVEASAEVKGFVVRLLDGNDVIATYGEPPFIKRKLDTPEGLQDILSTVPAIPAKPKPIKKR